jgi:hypothetical protein
MTAHGIVDMKLSPTSTAYVNNEMYVGITKFLTSSIAQSLGIQRIAYHTGSSATGTGTDYWDTSSRVGQNAFSVYRFMSASVPFNMLIQVADYSVGTFGSAPGNPGVIGGTLTHGIGIAFAARSDGVNAWSGSINNNGMDTKGAIVWASGSSTLFVYPRANSGGGTYAANKQYCEDASTYHAGIPQVDMRVNFICDENSVFWSCHSLSAYDPFYVLFTKYTPRPNVTASFPYVMLKTYYNDQPSLTKNTYGSLAGGTTREGGIAHPNPPSGSHTTMITYPVWYDDGQTTTFRPNTIINGVSTFEEHPIYLFSYEASYYGYVGYVDWARIAWNAQPFAMSADGSRAYFGRTGYADEKISVPWSGSVGSFGTHMGRNGVVF